MPYLNLNLLFWTSALSVPFNFTSILKLSWSLVCCCAAVRKMSRHYACVSGGRLCVFVRPFSYCEVRLKGWLCSLFLLLCILSRLRTKIPYQGLNECPSESRLCFAAPARDYSQDRTGTPDSDLQMRDENSVSICVMSTFPATFTVPEKRRLTSPWAWGARSTLTSLSPEVTMIFLFTQVTCGWSLQVSRYPFFVDLKWKCVTTSHPSPAMLAFRYTGAPLRPHPAFITTSEGGSDECANAMCVPYIKNSQEE